MSITRRAALPPMVGSLPPGQGTSAAQAPAGVLGRATQPVQSDLRLHVPEADRRIPVTKRGLLALGAASCLAGRRASAEAFRARSGGYPVRPIRLLVGFAPGGAADIVARLATPLMSGIMDCPVAVENRPGAGGNLATEMAARGPDDGHNLVMLTPGQVITNPLMMRVPYDPERDIVPIARMTLGQLVLVVRRESPARDVNDLLARARGSSDTAPLTYGSPGPGTSHHLAMEMLKRRGGFEAVHVPYRGSGQAIVDLLSGKIDMMIDSFSTSFPQIQAGALRPLAVTGPDPHPDLPGVPTLNSVVPGVVMTTWTGIGGPGTIPRDLVTYLAEVMRQVVGHRTFIDRLRELGSEASWLKSDSFVTAISKERREFADLIRAANIRAD
ncbi:MAG: tripartite tricarboxylate transporter substrate binding protein [Roseomonas mucosa]|nr:tripartite tricarboxylate transporter substrate binding protein [Roseomonas mucosa]